MIRVVIVDDHALVRSGLRLLLEAEEDITVEDEGGTADEAVRLARLHKPDVVLLDVVAADAELVAAVREVARGGRYVHPTLGARLAAAEAEAQERAASDPLSDREREVLRLLALGHTNQEIAKMLFISVRTAETHRAHIMQKLRLASRAELVRYALEHGLLEETSEA